MKGLARRANLTESSAKAAKSYKAKVASLTSERASLQAQIREPDGGTCEAQYDLKHASTVRVRAEDKENEPERMRRLPKTSCGLPERSCRSSRVTCRPR